MNLALHGLLLQVIVSVVEIQNIFRLCSAGEPGYLDFDNLPETNFSCQGKVIGGYYADVEAGCQMFHVCTIGQKDEIMDIKFLCLNGTVFDQETRVCERVDEVDCSKSERFYNLNLELYGNNAVTLSEVDTSTNRQEHQHHYYSSSRPNVVTTTTATTTTSTTPRPTPLSSTASNEGFRHPSGFQHQYYDQNYDTVTPLYNDKSNDYRHQYVYHNNNEKKNNNKNSGATSYQLFSNNQAGSSTTSTPHQIHQIRYTQSTAPQIIRSESYTIAPLIHGTSTIQTLLKGKNDAPSIINPIFHNHALSTSTEQFKSHNSNPRETDEYDSTAEGDDTEGELDGDDDDSDGDDNDEDDEESQINQEHNHGRRQKERQPLEAIQSTNQGKVSKLSISPVPQDDSRNRQVLIQNKDSLSPRITLNYLSGKTNDQITPRTTSYTSVNPQTNFKVTEHIILSTAHPISQLKSQQITFNLQTQDLQRVLHNSPPLLPSQSRVIVTAKASVSDESGRPLNTSQIIALPTIPSSYDDYKEGDESFDPFYRDVPKVSKQRTVPKNTETNKDRSRRKKRDTLDATKKLAQTYARLPELQVHSHNSSVHKADTNHHKDTKHSRSFQTNADNIRSILFGSQSGQHNTIKNHTFENDVNKGELHNHILSILKSSDLENTNHASFKQILYRNILNNPTINAKLHVKQHGNVDKLMNERLIGVVVQQKYNNDDHKPVPSLQKMERTNSTKTSYNNIGSNKLNNQLNNTKQATNTFKKIQSNSEQNYTKNYKEPDSDRSTHISSNKITDQLKRHRRALVVNSSDSLKPLVKRSSRNSKSSNRDDDLSDKTFTDSNSKKERKSSRANISDQSVEDNDSQQSSFYPDYSEKGRSIDSARDYSQNSEYEEYRSIYDDEYDYEENVSYEDRDGSVDFRSSDENTSNHRESHITDYKEILENNKSNNNISLVISEIISKLANISETLNNFNESVSPVIPLLSNETSNLDIETTNLPVETTSNDYETINSVIPLIETNITESPGIIKVLTELKDYNDNSTIENDTSKVTNEDSWTTPYSYDYVDDNYERELYSNLTETTPNTNFDVWQNRTEVSSENKTSFTTTSTTTEAVIITTTENLTETTTTTEKPTTRPRPMTSLFKPISLRKSYNYIPPTTTPNPVKIKPRLPLVNPNRSKPLRTYNDIAPKPVIIKRPLKARKKNNQDLDDKVPKNVRMDSKTEDTRNSDHYSNVEDNDRTSEKSVHSLNVPTTENSTSLLDNDTISVENTTFVSEEPIIVSTSTEQTQAFESSTQNNTEIIEELTEASLKNHSHNVLDEIRKNITHEQENDEELFFLVDVFSTSSTTSTTSTTTTTTTTTSTTSTTSTTTTTSTTSTVKPPVNTEPEVTPKTHRENKSKSLSQKNYQPSGTRSKSLPGFNCLDKELYRFYSDSRDCRLFHYCSPGFTVRQVLDFRFVCEEGTSFDETTQSCQSNGQTTNCNKRN